MSPKVFKYSTADLIKSPPGTNRKANISGLSDNTGDGSDNSFLLSPGRGAIDKNFRVKYISAIRTGHKHLSNRESFLAIPDNYIDEAVFLQAIPFDTD